MPLGQAEPAVSGPPVYSVAEITRLLKRHIEDEPLFQYVTVCGEMSNFKHHTSGHMYFVLKDSESCLRCVMFRSYAGRLRFRPQDGLEVYATGAIGIYETGGVYQLYVQYLEPRGVGDLHLAFQQLKEKLQAEGLFDEARKRPIPFLPRRIGVVTSPTGAAVRDIITILHRRMPGVEILVAPALVQGKGAAASIVAALEALVQWGDVDVIIVGRGGGSMEDLWPFNEEVVARAVAACPVPVISAVGHETDFTICDFAADLRAPTPSGAAELAVPVAAELLAAL
ncbi:MAG TPA: exodeoxyribonuclease VII large subunit, partial [Firmicutes bacterium]|nr:exodeoxyribonuclease VII large subunit [Bacillota bacterium]